MPSLHSPSPFFIFLFFFPFLSSRPLQPIPNLSTLSSISSFYRVLSLPSLIPSSHPLRPVSSTPIPSLPFPPSHLFRLAPLPSSSFRFFLSLPSPPFSSSPSHPLRIPSPPSRPFPAVPPSDFPSLLSRLRPVLSPIPPPSVPSSPYRLLRPIPLLSCALLQHSNQHLRRKDVSKRYTMREQVAIISCLFHLCFIEPDFTRFSANFAYKDIK